jgi:hypothetical protein
LDGITEPDKSIFHRWSYPAYFKREYKGSDKGETMGTSGSIVILDGFIASWWRFQNDLYMRLVVYRNPYDPTKATSDGREAADYITCRLVNGVAMYQSGFEKGVSLHIEGILESVDSTETLEDFLESAKKEKTMGSVNVETTGGATKNVTVKRSMLRVLVRNFAFNTQKSDSESKADSK